MGVSGFVDVHWSVYGEVLIRDDALQIRTPSGELIIPYSIMREAQWLADRSIKLKVDVENYATLLPSNRQEARDLYHEIQSRLASQRAAD